MSKQSSILEQPGSADADENKFQRSKDFKKLLLKDPKAIHEARQKSIKDLGLEKYIAELEIDGYTVVPPEVTGVSIGEIDHLTAVLLKKSEELTYCEPKNKKLDLVVAASYGGRWDIVNAINKIQDSGSNQVITEESFSAFLSTSAFKDPDLCIRTGNELRVSNFLLWQIAYAELYFTNVYWPDFGKKDLYEALLNYQNRERRFGKTSDQINV